MKRLILAVFALLSLSFASAQIPIPPVPTARVTDTTGTLTQPQIDSLCAKLKALEDKNGAQILVYMAPTLNGMPIEDFGIQAARAWKPGQKKDNSGAILLVFKNDHKMRIEVGRGLEGVIPDTTAKEILDDSLKPNFRANNFYGGINAGVDQMIHYASIEKFVSPVKGAVNHSDDSWIIGVVLAILLGGAVIGGIILYRKSKREEEEEREREEEEEREREEEEEPERILERLRINGLVGSRDHTVYVAKSRPAEDELLLPIVAASAVVATTHHHEEEAPRRHHSSYDDDYHSSSSSDSSSSSSSSFDSFSSGGGGFDGGGSSGSW